ncbi:hypothetical protein [Pantoea agglomerans]|uniref:hypothetical protein n=1 Tax=Enterobacter agglomerans TaxID=549 RepID=UPI00301BF9EA
MNKNILLAKRIAKMIAARWYVIIAIYACVVLTAHLLTVNDFQGLRCSGLDYLVLGDSNPACKIHKIFTQDD